MGSFSEQRLVIEPILMLLIINSVLMEYNENWDLLFP